MPAKGKPSNNPAGRPRGSGVNARLHQELVGTGKVGPVFDTLYAQALEGDVASASLLLSRAVPPVRARAAMVEFELPDGSLTEQAKAVLRAAADGVLSTDQAAELITAISRVVQIEQADELRRLLEKLEYGDIA